MRFNGTVHGRRLPAGTYQIRAHRKDGATVLHVLLVIVDSGPPTPTELERARGANVCGPAPTFSEDIASGNQLASAPTSNGGSGTLGSSVVRRNAGTGKGPYSSSGTPSAAPFSPARVSQNAANPFVIAAFALAVLFLGLAALPQAAVPDPRLTHMLARHRIEVALAGAGALAAALLALALA